jgi:hypothetical protein
MAVLRTQVPLRLRRLKTAPGTAGELFVESDDVVSLLFGDTEGQLLWHPVPARQEAPGECGAA